MGIPHYKDPAYGRLWQLVNKDVPDVELPRAVGDLKSCLVNQADMDCSNFKYWMRQLKEPPGYCRKQWEHAYICQALWQLGFLRPGMHGLGFGVGKEPLVAYFAGHGCSVMATDVAIDASTRGWLDNDQHVHTIGDFNERRLLPDEEFKCLVQYREVNMNSIPGDLIGYDFTWSANSFDHTGSLSAGLSFVENSLNCLRPGGVSIHTTEFNESSNDNTIESGGVVFYRKRDLEAFFARLSASGKYGVATVDLTPGPGPIDALVDYPPYHNEPHLKLFNLGYVVSSVGFIIKKF